MSAAPIKNEKIQTEIELENPEWLLYVIVTMLLWVFGFVDLINESSELSQVVLGRYSVPYFAFLVIYALIFFVFFAFLRQKNIERLKKWIVWLQVHPRVAVPLTILLITTFVITSEFDRFTKYSVFQMTVLAHIFLFLSILLISNSDPTVKKQFWRRFFLIPLGILVLVEIVLQLLTVTRLLPAGVQHEAGYFVPYGRVYQTLNGETLNTTMNRYGWYYPAFRNDPDLFNVALIGDSYLQGIQIEPEQNMGMVLDELLNNGDMANGANEVMGFGMPGFGPGTYRTLVEYSINAYAPDEIIIFLNLGNDFQNSTKSQERYFFYFIDEEKDLRLESSSYRSWHDSQHLTLRAHEPFFLWQTLKSHFLLPTVIKSAFSSQSAAAQANEDSFTTTQVEGIVWRKPRPWIPTHNSDWDIVFETTQENGFFFTTNGDNDTADGIAMTQELLMAMQEMAADAGTTLRLVTVPVFPPAFYEQYKGIDWTPIVGDFDLFYGERLLADFAQEAGIPFLSMGAVFESASLTPAEIQEFYFDDETAYLNAKGHAFFAGMVQDCFYGSGANGCFIP